MTTSNSTGDWTLRLLRKVRGAWVPGSHRGFVDGGWLSQNIRTLTARECRKMKGPFLEVGCGEGLFLRMMERNDRWVGISLDYPPLLKARATGGEGVKLVQAEAGHLPFRAETFRCVVCINTLSSFAGWDSVFRLFEEVRRVTRKGGVFIFDMRNWFHPLNRINHWVSKWGDRTLGRPVRSFRKGELIDAGRLKGLDVRVAASASAVPFGIPVFHIMSAVHRAG